MIRCLATICLSFALIAANAAELHGRVISVAGGDTVTVLDAAKQQHRVRLAGIDALERGQLFADQSREYLAQWIHGQDVIVDWHKRAQYGRLGGGVKAAGIKPN